MYIPASTYRIQFNNKFTFKHLEGTLKYLSSLGIGAIYASPVFCAVPGSNHGYDVTDPTAFNREIGPAEQFEKISSWLEFQKIGWIQDIVPNHMAFHPDNKWLMDVLEKGKQSAYADFFDIDWDHPVFNNKIMVPILGKTTAEAVESRELKLTWDNGGFYINYYDFKLPVSGESFHELVDEYKVLEGSYFVGQGIANADYKADPAFLGFGWTNSRERFQAIYKADSSFENFVDNICDEVSSNQEKLLELLSKQHYILTHWQVVEQALNYRRFFPINGLISLRMEQQSVFEAYHSFIKEMVTSGKFQGLRIDHVDGLLSPEHYFERLRASMGENTFIVVEKILERHEELNKDWPLQGSSGYDFLALVNNVLIHQEGCRNLQSFYKDFSGIKAYAEDFIYLKKKLVLQTGFRGDWDNICRKIEQSGLLPYDGHVTKASLHEAVGEFLVNCPVYKFYSCNLPLEADDEEAIKRVIDRAAQRTPHLAAPLNKLKNIFLGNDIETSNQKELALGIFLKCMQYTGSLMAKGVEDTAMYAWAGFLAHNEVGDSIDSDGITVDEFHQRMQERELHYPLSLNATATHDTKRGEDARARLNVLSNFAKEWKQLVQQWSVENQSLKSLINGNPAPDLNEEYFIYQTLVGAIQMDSKEDALLAVRLAQFIPKALREAKINSNWNNPDETYENAVISFVTKLLDENSNFMKGFRPFLEQVIPWGIVNSLSQVVLKCTCPGIPDFYQGTELWDFSLVDPDNRRLVDYAEREKLLDELKSKEPDLPSLFHELSQNPNSGKIKLWFTHRLMQERRSVPDIFDQGKYLPLQAKGEFKDHILAFARVLEQSWHITVIPLHGANLSEGKNLSIDWKKTSIELPPNAPDRWELIWDGSLLKAGGEVFVADVLKYNYPAVLKGKSKTAGRGSGLLLHLTSLPGKYGAGDFGKEAYSFVDFLKSAKQTYWQILPFNPAGAAFSPYSSSSAFAGNILFIDPEDLLKKKLLKNLPKPVSEADTADFATALEIKEQVLNEAFENYTIRGNPLIQSRFEQFCREERFWLRDFALFSLLKQQFKNDAWINWPEDFRKREPSVIQALEERFASELNRIKFGQYLFSTQFKKLKKYTNSFGIKIIGDVPIYISYDSSDVWANPQFFNLNHNLTMKTVGGVPPDYFSENGQLWDMPVYNWANLEADNFEWWLKRIARNLEFCDILRLDHFRGFASYWEVPAGETTAINGKWTKGPGSRLFSELKKAFPHMPFIAEDLGDIDEDVYDLRDAFGLPGMRVLQFAFGSGLPQSEHIPHNYQANSVVYTGTHDNNTIKGWFRKETNNEMKKQLKAYFNIKLTANNVGREFIRLAYSSVARMAIVPAQDILQLGEKARFNTPSQAYGNWRWKLISFHGLAYCAEQLRELTILYGRDKD